MPDSTEADRYRYHAFPRRHRARTATIRKGLAILESMVSSGLLLRPERVEIPGELQRDGTVGPDHWVAEIFASFTVRARADVAQHAERSGPFALEFEVDSLISMGALPVWYLPMRRDIGAFGTFGLYLMARHKEIAGVLEQLRQIDGLLCDPDTKRLTLRAREDGRAVGAIEDIRPIRDLFGQIFRDFAPPIELDRTLKAVASLIYPVDAQNTDALRFFEQREWRLLANVASSEAQLCDEATPTEKERLLSLDRPYFAREMDFADYTKARRVDRCCFVREVGGRNFLNYARRLIVPDDVISEARMIVEHVAPLLEVVPHA